MKKGLFVLLCLSSFCLASEDDSSNILDENTDQKQQTTLLEKDLLSTPSSTSIKKIEEKSFNIAPLDSKSPTIAVGLSMLMPGLGHVYLNDLKTAGVLFGSSGLSYSILNFNESQKEIQYTSLLAYQNTWFYSVYAVYRDTRSFNRNFGYKYTMPNENITDLALAPVNFSILKKPEVWGGMLGALCLAYTVSYVGYSDVYTNIKCSIEPENIKPLFAFPIGIGEETFFRGYLQPMLSEVFSPLGGIILSSLAFGAVHIPNAHFLPKEHRWRYYSFSVPFITILGGYFGWLTHKNKSLKESVALHVWYDFAIFLASSYAIQSAISKKPKFAICIPF